MDDCKSSPFIIVMQLIICSNVKECYQLKKILLILNNLYLSRFD